MALIRNFSNEAPRDLEADKHTIKGTHFVYDILEELSLKGKITEEENETYIRNLQHMKIMLGYQWFKDTCEEEELKKFKKYGNII
tara:strand:+ start:52 stop:306 length:255 start_codon:yes stop_codon:yes gene_type:complete